MSGIEIAIVVLTGVAIVVTVVLLVRRPGPDARGVTGPPVSQRGEDQGWMPPYPGTDRPAGPGAENEDPDDLGGVSTNGAGRPGDRSRGH